MEISSFYFFKEAACIFCATACVNLCVDCFKCYIENVVFYHFILFQFYRKFLYLLYLFSYNKVTILNLSFYRN